jgi:hypothetical protein
MYMYVQASKNEIYLMGRTAGDAGFGVLVQTRHKVTGTPKNARATENNSLRKIASCFHLVLPACKQATPSLTATFAQSVKQ